MPDMDNEELYWDRESWGSDAHLVAVYGGDLRCPGVGEGIASERGAIGGPILCVSNSN